MADWSPERVLLTGIAIQALQDAMAADDGALDYLAWWLNVDANRLSQAIRGRDRRYKRGLMSQVRVPTPLEFRILQDEG